MNTAAKITEFLQGYAGSAFGTPCPPVRPELIAEVEQRMGVELPSSIKALYLEMNGVGPIYSPEGRRAPNLMLPNFDWMSLEWSLSCLENTIESMTFMAGKLYPAIEIKDDPVLALALDRRRLPIGTAGSDVYVYIDMCPSQYGSMGQLIRIDPEDGEPQYMARSFEAHLESVFERARTGKIIWNAADCFWTRPDGTRLRDY